MGRKEAAMFGEGKGCLKVCSYLSAVFTPHTSTVTRYTGRVQRTIYLFDNTHRTLYVGTYVTGFVPVHKQFYITEFSSIIGISSIIPIHFRFLLHF